MPPSGNRIVPVTKLAASLGPFNSVAVPAPELPADAFHAVGYEGQFVTVVPSRRLVVVRLGLSRGDHVWDHEMFLARLLEAFPRQQ